MRNEVNEQNAQLFLLGDQIILIGDLFSRIISKAIEV